MAVDADSVADGARGEVPPGKEGEEVTLVDWFYKWERPRRKMKMKEIEEKAKLSLLTAGLTAVVACGLFWVGLEFYAVACTVLFAAFLFDVRYWDLSARMLLLYEGGEE